MNNENFHPVLPEPPLAHALHKWNAETRMLSYEYNGRNIITIVSPTKGDVGYRHGSDGNLQSMPFIQQLYIMLDQPVTAKMTFNLSDDAVNMRPHRADSEQAILGQIGRPLISGVNGVYDINQDLLIDWYGCDWHWSQSCFRENLQGELVAELELELGPKPFFINLRMQYYRKHLGYSYHKPWQRRPNLKPVAGWCSWEAFRRSITIENLKDEAVYFAKQFKDFGFEYIQLDDGYQKMPLPFDAKMSMAEGWAITNEQQFPEGHAEIVATIKSYGLSPGIWTNSNITNPGFPQEHPESIFRKPDGQAVLGEWIDFLYNCTSETLARQVEPIFRMFREYGYTYIKIDAIRHLLFDGLQEAVRQGIISNDDAEARFRAYMEACRMGIGKDVYFLASWGEISQTIGLVDACRISMDANPTWAGVRMQLVESARWFHAQRILFLIDPDHICARTRKEWARSILSFVSLSGGLYMLSDLASDYDEDRLQMIRQTLPPLPTMTGETGPLELNYPAFTWTKLHGFAVHSKEGRVKTENTTIKEALDMAGIYPTMNDKHPFSTLWAFHIVNSFRKWCVIGRFATVPLEKCLIKMKSIGLEDKTEYLAFDFWKQKYLGRVQGELNCSELDLGHCQILSLMPALPQPQFMASTRHISMDAVSVKAQVWNHGELTLGLAGIVGTTEWYWFHAPREYTLDEYCFDGGTITITREDEVIKAKVNFKAINGNIGLRFKSS